MKTLENFIAEKNTNDFNSIYTVINEKNISLLEKMIDYVKKNGETQFKVTSIIDGELTDVEVFNYDNEPSKRYIKL